jgi:hypothetical protein
MVFKSSARSGDIAPANTLRLRSIERVTSRIVEYYPPLSISSVWDVLPLSGESCKSVILTLLNIPALHWN